MINMTNIQKHNNFTKGYKHIEYILERHNEETDCSLKEMKIKAYNNKDTETTIVFCYQCNKELGGFSMDIHYNCIENND